MLPVTGWEDPNFWLRLIELVGWPGVLCLFGFLAWRFRPGPAHERKPWVFRVEVALSEDTLARLAATARRVSRRDDESDDVTPEVVVRAGAPRR